MGVLLVLLALAAAQPVAEPAVDNEITVIANKLRAWQGSWKLRKGAIICKTTRSTGDRLIDAIGCDAMVQCIQPLAPQWSALNEAKLPKDEANRRADALQKEAKVGECVFARREAGIAALAAARRSKRS
jgi:hypothetical protein